MNYYKKIIASLVTPILPIFSVGATLLTVLIAITINVVTTSSAYANKKSDVAAQAWDIISQIEQRENIPSGLLHSMSLVESGRNIQGSILPWPYTINVNHSRKYSFTQRADVIEILNKLYNVGFRRFDVWVDGGVKRNIKLTTATAYINSANLNYPSNNASSPAEQIAKTINIGKGSTAINFKNTKSNNNFKIRGKGFAKRFNSKVSAANHAYKLLAIGHNNIDVGLLQVNWKYHSKNFNSLVEAFDPYHNANYAVKYLRKHKATKNWWESVGRYHSGTKKYAKRYIANVYAMYKRIHRT